MNVILRLFLVFAFVGLVLWNCSHAIHHSSPPKAAPRAVYVDDQIIEAWPALSAQRNHPYLQATLRNGETQCGFLAEVADRWLTIQVDGRGGSEKPKVKRQISKQQILLLKVW
ncbi:MAG TPA: hypothetical protein PK843_10460 [bacterium]|nr:hypothetical protein [bacterium]